jgi:hypothetical protein
VTPLREVLNDIGHKRLGAISSGYYPPHTALSGVAPRLKDLEQRVQQPNRSRTEIVAAKVAQCVESRSCAILGPADWRIVPWVMWTGTSAADQAWFLDALFRIISADRPKSVIRALVHAYVSFFDPAKPSFARVGRFLLEDALRAGERLGDRWLAINARCQLFDPAKAPQCIAQLILGGGNVDKELTELGIAREQADSRLASVAFSYAYRSVAQNLKSVTDQAGASRAIEQLLSWASGDAREFRYQKQFVPMATALLETFNSSNLAIETKDRTVRYFVEAFGDPRLNRAHWHGVTQDAMDAAMRVLVRSTLRDFTKVIDATADARHWNERRPFWLGYYEMGAIEDAWVAFGPKAISRAGRFEHTYARLDNASDTAHSALILRIRDLIIVEWSHNGRCRFFPRVGKSWTPELYAPRYNFLVLHRESDATGDYLPHMLSWQYRFANRIYRDTRVQHPKFGIGWA